jgi:hypothetical protein
MKYLKFRTTGNVDYIPVGWNLDSIIMMYSTTGNIRNVQAVDAAAQDVSVNTYEAELNNLTVNGTSSITTWGINQVIRAINANPSADVIPCVGTDAVTGEPVLWEDYSFNN